MRISIISTTLFLILFQSLAYADGMFVWRNEDVDIHEPEQKAFIVHDDGWEDLVLEVKYTGAPQEFGWIVPLPARPEMRPARARIFAQLSKATQSPDKGMSEASRRLLMTQGIDDMLTATQRRVGIYDVTLLEGGDGRQLQDWLSQNGFLLRKTANAVIDDYLRRNWVFVAMKIASDAVDSTVAKQLASGTIQPIHFRFQADEPIYPLKITSTTTQESEVLLYILAPQARIAAPIPVVDWEVRVQSRVRWSRFYDYSDAGAAASDTGGVAPLSLDDIRSKYSDRADQMVLTKLRASFQPDQMDDLVFIPYSPIDALQDDNLIARTEAVTYIGHRKEPSGVLPLIFFLESAPTPSLDTRAAIRRSTEDGIAPGQDIRCALWALGQLGDGSAVPILKRWARSRHIWNQIEAIEALSEVDVDECVPICLEYFANAPRPEYGDVYRRPFIKLCRDHLVRSGGASCVPVLQEMANEYYDPDSWNDVYINVDNDIGQSALLACAACGGTEAQAELERALRQAAPYCSVRYEDEYSRSIYGKSRHDFPYVITLGLGGRAQRGGGSLLNGRPVNAMRKVLASRLEVRDRIFRSVALDTTAGSTVPDDVRAALLARVESLQPADIDLLLAVWRRATTSPFLRTVDVYNYRDGPAQTIAYNVDAIAAAYALGVHGRAEELIRLQSQFDDSDPVLQAELVVALALTDDVRAVQPVLDYVREIWSGASRSPAFVYSLENEVSLFRGWPSELVFDLRYRHHPISQLLASHGVADVRALAGDESETAAFRLYWMYYSSFRSIWRNECAEKAGNLRSIRRTASQSSMLTGIDWHLERLSRSCGDDAGS